MSRRSDGLCECGCGERTNLAPSTSARDGLVKGQPMRFVYAHNPRTQKRSSLGAADYDERDMGYPTPCWVWLGCVNETGYSRVGINGRTTSAHRAMYLQEVGPIPDGMDLDHLCRVRNCINPAHLEVVTRRENLRRGLGTKLTDADRAAIVADTRSHRAIAAAYGTAHSTITRVKADA